MTNTPVEKIGTTQIAICKVKHCDTAVGTSFMSLPQRQMWLSGSANFVIWALSLTGRKERQVHPVRCTAILTDSYLRLNCHLSLLTAS